MTEKEREDIKKRLDKAIQIIRPYLKEDGGDVELIGFNEDLEVTVKLIGACNSCNMSFQTLKFGVEQTIKRFVPEITAIKQEV